MLDTLWLCTRECMHVCQVHGLSCHLLPSHHVVRVVRFGYMSTGLNNRDAVWSWLAICLKSTVGSLVDSGAFLSTSTNVLVPIMLPFRPGMYSSLGSDVCSVCETGHYCGSNETSAVDMITGGGWESRSDMAGVCFNGTYCAAGMTRAPGEGRKNDCLAGQHVGSLHFVTVHS